MLQHTAKPTRKTKKPNILLILTDQQRHDAVGYISPKVITPNLDRLASQSVNCTQAVVQSPQCQPNRAALLTSRYPTTLGQWWNGIPLDEQERTMGNVFRDIGYETGYYGKLHIDNKRGHKHAAQHFGFNSSYLYEDWAADVNYFDHGIAASNNKIKEEFFLAMAPNKKPSKKWDSHQGPWTGRFSVRELHHEDIVTNKAIDFIRQKREEPYFCVVSYHGPHPPYAAPPPFNTMYDPKSFDVPEKMLRTHFGFMMTPHYWRLLKSQYFGAVSWIDDNIGKLLAETDEDTIIIFTSDHGDILGDHGHFSKGLYAYEGNIRVPMLMRFPDQKPSEYTHTVQSIDILPTLMKSMEMPLEQQMQGRSVFEHLQGDKMVNSFAFCGLGYNPRLRMVRTPRFKYWWYKEEFLFNLLEDPAEDQNIASVHKNLVSKMRLKLIEAMIAAEDPMPIPIER